MRLRNYLLAGCLSVCALAAHAETVNNLYQVRETVGGQTPEERDAATQRALETLVLRLTGDPKAFNASGLAAVRKDPQQIISQYGYEAGPPESLRVDFDPASTDNLLRQSGLPTWGNNRPSVLAWWLNEGAGGANLVGDGQPTAEPLRRAAQHRGLPLRLPLADLGEQALGTAKTLDGSDATPLRAASERYGADGLLAVHAKQDGGKWTAQWHLYLGDRPEQGKVEGADPAALADAVLLAVSERLAPRYVVKSGGGGAATDSTLQVEGMTLEHYAALSRLLEPFNAKLKSVDGDKVVYQVSGSSDQLRAQLALGKLSEMPPEAAPVVATQPLAPGAAPAPAPQPASGLRFHW
ncbi:DUF2066 domain-containing protein [Pseudomonas putida]